MLVVYHIEPGVPPGLEKRTQPSYTASVRLLLNNASNPIVRTGETSIIPRPTRESGEPRDPIIETLDPATGALIEAANLLPVVIESDIVTRLREQEVGRPRGSVSAQQLFARETPGGGLRPSGFPVIELTATSPTVREATSLAQGTVTAFQRWLVREQERSEVSPKQRIVIQPLNDTAKVEEQNESSYGLAFVVAGAVLAGVALLISLLHRAFPRRARPTEPAGDGASTDGSTATEDGAESPPGRVGAGWLQKPAPAEGSTGSAKAPRSSPE